MGDSANYGLFSPIPKFGFPDYKRGSGQWLDWLEEQLHYIENGYEVGGDKISGRLYYKLNWTKMLITDKNGNKRPSYPFYADGIREFYDTIEYCFKEKKNFLYGKGRDKGFTYDIAALSLYQMQFVEYSKILSIFPGGQSPARKNFQDAYSLAFEELDPDMKCYPGLADNKEMLMYGWEQTDTETGAVEKDGNFSSLTMKLATDADVGKSGRYKMVILEEFGEIENSKDLIITSDANMREGANKFGIVIAGGTSNAMKAGYKDFRDIWYNPEALGFVKLFCPAQKMYWGYVNPQTGKSDQEGAKQHRIDTVRSKLKEGSRELMIEKQNYPFDEDEMFIAISKSPFNPELAAKQIGKILSDKKLQQSIQRGNLWEKTDPETGKKIVEFHIDNVAGRFLKFKEPLPEGALCPDVGAVDSYRFGDIEAPDSKGAILGYRPFQGMNQPGNLVTFLYLHRFDDKNLFFEDCRLAALYWRMKLLIEKTDDDIFTFFRQRNALALLKKKPKLIQNPFVKESEDYGVSPSGGNKERAIEFAVQEFLKFVENIVFVELLDELINFGSKNTDLAMAYIWAVLHSFDSIRILDEFKKKPPPKKKKFSPYAISDGNGGFIVINSPQKEALYANSS